MLKPELVSGSQEKQKISNAFQEKPRKELEKQNDSSRSLSVSDLKGTEHEWSGCVCT
jgi:hypothetical protein